MISRSKTLIIAAAAVLSVVGFKSALAAPQDVTNQIKVTPNANQVRWSRMDY